jgi:hypothetical protein
MYALLTGDLDAVDVATREAVAAGTAAGEADTYAIERVLTSGVARQAGDTATLAREATRYEAFGLQEGVTSVAAEAAVLWLAAGQPARAEALLHQHAGADLSSIPRDVDWLLTVASLTEVAAAVGSTALAGSAVELLRPYAGRAVVNAGGVAFIGVVDDYLGAACRLLGREEEADRFGARATGLYARMGAGWWLHRLPSAGPGARQGRPGVVHLRPGDGGIWWVGREGSVTTVRDVRGLHYLRLLLQRPGIDIPALELSDAVCGHPGRWVDEGSAGVVLDRQALGGYRRRLGEIDQDLEEARSWSDAAGAARLEREGDALLAEPCHATGLGGRSRVPASTRERARVAVRKAIAAAISRVAVVDPSLGRLLLDTVSTGTACRYDPDPGRPTSWVLDA